MLGGITMWIARDKDKRLWLYEIKPIKGDTEWVITSTTAGYCRIDEDDLDEFEDVKWEDEEPRELVLKPINKK